MKNTQAAALAALLVYPTFAYAHSITAGGGFLSGFAHPILGFDHFLAMLSVGILSAQMGGLALWSVPITFVSLMLIGGILGIQGIPLLSVELGITVSVLALGVALAAEKKLPWLFALLFVGFFAIFHGYAHGTEMPSLAQPALYVLGFVIGTAAIHICGLLIGWLAQKNLRGVEILRFVGAGIAGVGVHLLIQ